MENVVGLIQKLLALSKSPNENEAAAAMAKAQELLIKYNLDMATVQTPTKQDSDEAGMMNEIVDFSDFEKWQSILINAVSTRNFCKIIRISGEEFHILGKKANVRSVEAMYNWLEPQIIRLIDQSGFKRGDKTSFAMGIISTIGKKLDESKEAYQVKYSESRALIVNVQREVDGWFKSEYPHTTHSRTTCTNGSAYGAGQQAGHGVSVYGSSRQVSGRLLLN
jgi:hypothetical protein